MSASNRAINRQVQIKLGVFDHHILYAGKADLNATALVVAAAWTIVHIIGDASATTQPKAGHIANQEAKICADAVVRLLAGRSPDPSPITNSACYSPITADTASWLTAVFALDPVSRNMLPVAGASGEAAGRSQDNYQEMFKWFNTLMEDSFALS